MIFVALNMFYFAESKNDSLDCKDCRLLGHVLEVLDICIISEFTQYRNMFPQFFNNLIYVSINFYSLSQWALCMYGADITSA